MGDSGATSTDMILNVNVNVNIWENVWCGTTMTTSIDYELSIQAKIDPKEIITHEYKGVKSIWMF